MNKCQTALPLFGEDGWLAAPYIESIPYSSSPNPRPSPSASPNPTQPWTAPRLSNTPTAPAAPSRPSPRPMTVVSQRPPPSPATIVSPRPSPSPSVVTSYITMSITTITSTALATNTLSRPNNIPTWRPDVSQNPPVPTSYASVPSSTLTPPRWDDGNRAPQPQAPSWPDAHTLSPTRPRPNPWTVTSSPRSPWDDVTPGLTQPSWTSTETVATPQSNANPWGERWDPPRTTDATRDVPFGWLRPTPSDDDYSPLDLRPGVNPWLRPDADEERAWGFAPRPNPWISRYTPAPTLEDWSDAFPTWRAREGDDDAAATKK
jgi:hypothetical protein